MVFVQHPIVYLAPVVVFSQSFSLHQILRKKENKNVIVVIVTHPIVFITLAMSPKGSNTNH